MTVKRVFALATVVVAAAFSAPAQTRELNPTVKVLARPQGPVPAECATDPAIVPALEAEAVEPVTAAAPPSNDLRASLRRLQVAAEVNDYAVFKSELAEARRAAAAHPPGGERNAANDALQVFGDIGRVWDYAMTSPTGSFFDATAQSGSLLNAMKRYPDYGRAIADQTITSGGRTLYPTSETRRFLARESARRLTRLGVSTPAHVARGAQPEPLPRRVVIAPPPVKKTVQVATKPTTPKKTAKTTTAKTTTPKTTTPKPAVKTVKATPPKTKEVAIKATPLAKPKPAAPPPVKVADTSTMPPGPPIVSTTQPTVPTTTSAAPPTQTTTPPAATSATDTTVSTATSPTDTSVTAAPDT
ncbi:MAG: hypothetical protein JWO97_2917, partial [Acidobacteria bacterium]|nr:hypothetical protein [Acidobacteriota bacterium]